MLCSDIDVRCEHQPGNAVTSLDISWGFRPWESACQLASSQMPGEAVFNAHVGSYMFAPIHS